MKNFPSLKKYLKSHETSNLTIEELGQLRKTYKKEYYKEYNKRRTQGKRINIRVSQKQYTAIIEAKKSYSGISLNAYMIKMVFAYLQKAYLPHDPQASENIIKAIHTIGNNLNQIIHKLHLKVLRNSTKNHPSTDDSLERILDGYQALKKETLKLIDEVKEYTSSPPPQLLKYSWESIKHDKAKLHQLIEYLLNHLEHLNNDN